MRTFILAVLPVVSWGQSVQVPHKAEVAGVVLTLRDDARREIQADVDALHASPKYFNLKAERARTYFPTIERILQEERVPDDVKYLVIQESALIADAVSVSNAVGYWQFKDYTALEMGLRVDAEVDERMNIVASTRAAAGYLKKNNYYFNNWLMAIQAYQMGAGAAMDAVGDSFNGARHMEITSNTYWYVKKFLAHKFAYEAFVQEKGKVQIRLYETSSGPRLRELAEQYQMEEEELKEYNKWIRNDRLPSDKVYAVVVPSGVADEGFTNLLITSSKVSKAEPATMKADPQPDPDFVPVERLKRVAGLRAIVPQPGDTWMTLASEGGVDLTELLRFNDREISDPVLVGMPYYVQRKRSRGQVERHTVEPGEGWWEISQRYGVRESKLRKFNQASTATGPTAGTMVWLQAGAGFAPEEVVSEPVPMGEFEWDSEEVVGPEAPTAQADTTLGAIPEIVIQSDSLHVVRKGETLYSIAKAYGLTPGELASYNHVGPTDTLKEGQVLRLQAAGMQGSQTGEFHEVTADDTLYGIARSNNTTVRQLMEWNQKSDFTITVGERLRVRPKAR